MIASGEEAPAFWSAAWLYQGSFAVGTCGLWLMVAGLFGYTLSLENK